MIPPHYLMLNDKESKREGAKYNYYIYTSNTYYIKY